MEPIILCIFFITSPPKWIFWRLWILPEEGDKKILAYLTNILDIGYRNRLQVLIKANISAI